MTWAAPRTGSSMLSGRPNMPPMPERIRTRAPGWQAVWKEIVDDLDGAIRAKIRKDFPRLPAEAREEISQELLVWYHERATRGTLLERWDGTRSVVGFLTGSMVHNRVLDWISRAKEAPRSLVSGADGEERSFDPAAPEVVEADPDRSRAQETLAANLKHPWELAPPPNGEVTRDYRTAGTELFLRLNWKHPVSREVRAQLQSFLSLLPRDGWENELKERLRSKIAALETRCAAAEEQMDAGVSRDARTARAVLAKALFQIQICPLEPEDLRGMTGVTSANAQQLVSSYRRALPELIPVLGQAWLVMQRLHRAREGVS